MEAKNNTGKKSSKNNRNKAQLQKDLLKTQERLEKKEIELARCLQELQGTQQQLADVQQFKKQLAASEKALSTANSKIKSLEKDIEQDKAAKQNQQQIAGQDRVKNLAQVYSEIEAVDKRGMEFESKLDVLAKQVGMLVSEKETPYADKPVNSKSQIPKSLPQEQRSENLDTNKVEDTRISEESVSITNSPLENPATPEREIISNGHSHIQTSNRDHALRSQTSLQSITLQQSGQRIEPGAVLLARTPFTVETQLVLPKPPAREYLELDSPYYMLRATAKMAESKEVAIVESIEGQLDTSQKVYKNTIDMPKLSPGKYILEVFALAPAIRLGEQKKVEIVIGE